MIKIMVLTHKNSKIAMIYIFKKRDKMHKINKKVESFNIKLTPTK